MPCGTPPGKHAADVQDGPERETIKLKSTPAYAQHKKHMALIRASRMAVPPKGAILACAALQ